VRAVVQRVSSARIRAREPGSGAPFELVGEMGSGLLGLVAVAPEDGEAEVEALADKLVHLRIFPDEEGRMNRSLLDTGGMLGVVSQFTLYASTRKGRRPYFGGAADPTVAEPLVGALARAVAQRGVAVVGGRFGADMELELVNVGPVTLLLDTADWNG
jgi:D-tyrosyl-tRNA(Tyr) deacylase